MELSKKLAKENLSKLITKFESELNLGKIWNYNEEATKTAFIQPLLKDVLGWDVNDRDEVSPEEKVSHGRVDYGLKIDNKIKIFVEAKPPKADLEKHIEQAVKYGYNRKTVPFVLLTDFEGLKLFDVTVKPDFRNLRKGLKIDLKWKQYLDNFDDIWLLSKESTQNGETDKLIKAKPKDRVPVDKAILEDLKEWQEKLAKDIYKNNPGLFKSDDHEKNAHYLREITQRFLDRIIFMRFCEDRKFIHRPYLKSIFEERSEAIGTAAMTLLRDEFKHYNIIFDSDLFRPQEWEDNLLIDFKIINEIIMQTYNPYQFDVIPLEVLGNIYEQYLGYTIRLTDHQVKYELKPDVRKAGGVYYTPEYIVDYIVKNTVGKQLQALSAVKIKKLRILDPACGSGSFLIRAYDEMLSWYKNQKRKKAKESDMQHKLELRHDESEHILSIEEKAYILREHIFGVDIDEQAVEVTKLSLMLKMLEGEFGILPGRNILPMLDKNIKCGNSLISGDTIELMKYFGKDYYEVKPFNWNEKFRQIMIDKDGFDVVIGNPPWGGDIDKITQYIKEHYPNSTKGYRDTCKLFTDKGLSLTDNRGIFSFIVPSAFMFQPRYIDVRRLLRNFNILILWNIGDKVFGSKVAAPSCIFIVKKLSPQPNSIIASFDTSHISDNKERAKISLSPPYRKIRQSNYLKTAMESFVTYYRELGKNEVRLDEILDCKDCGIKYQRVGVGMEQKGKTDLASRLYYQGERRSSQDHKVLIGSDLNRNGWFMDCSHDLYFRGDFKRLIKKNEIVYFNENIFNLSEKIVWRQTSDRIRAAIIGIHWFANTLQCGILRKPRYDVRYALGLLNSKFLNFIYIETVKESGRVFPQVKLAKVRALPFRIVNFKNVAEKKHHDDLVALVDVMLDLNKKLHTAKGNANEQIQRQIEKTDQEIDELVYKLYGITDEERKIIEGVYKNAR